MAMSPEIMPNKNKTPVKRKKRFSVSPPVYLPGKYGRNTAEISGIPVLLN